MRRLMVVVGTRPNFVKVTRFKEVATAKGIAVEFVHTSQHSDPLMSDVFFEQFGLRCDHVLRIPDGTPLQRLGSMITALSALIEELKPNGVVVVGDVDSTLAGALAAKRCGSPLLHVESGLRNGDLQMPEEVNRILTDRIADHCFTTEPSGGENLLREGKAPDRIHFVGNTMIDTLVACSDRIASADVSTITGPEPSGHALVTIHRPVNVDTEEALRRVVDLLKLVARTHRVIFPVHPRTRERLERFGLRAALEAMPSIRVVPPSDYFGFQKLIATSAFVLTDSGGVQEEATFRGVPCLTLRSSTERPITITEGTNELITFDGERVASAIASIMNGSFKRGRVPELWDGQATERIFAVIDRVL